MFVSILAWSKQPTTVAGFSALVGTLMGYMTGSMTPTAAISVAVGSLVAMILPDNTQAKTAAQALVVDAVKVVEAVETPNSTTTTTTTMKAS